MCCACGFSDSEEEDPYPAATQMREAGITIVTVAVIENDGGGEQFVEKIGELASDGCAFKTEKSGQTKPATLSDEIEKAFCNGKFACVQK